jgi:two-component system, LuxR family, response regulator FixJ
MPRLENSLFTVLDPARGRASEIAAVFKPLARNIVVRESVDTLFVNWPLTGIILVHLSLVEQFQERLRQTSRWRTHLAYGENASAYSLVDAITGGAIEFLSLPIDARELPERAILWRRRGGRVARLQIRRMRAQKLLDQCTKRELQTIKLIALGWTGPRIADHLRISPRTVEVHRLGAFKKLAAPNGSVAARIVAEAELWLDEPKVRAGTPARES